jgi:hypothetical protein
LWLLLHAATSSLGAMRAGQSWPDADALYRHRDDLSSARAAAAIWAAHADASFEAAWRLARVSYWLGSHGSADERRRALEAGVAAGERAARLEPNRPEGHFWLAANMGALAQGFGMMQGLKYRGRIKQELERTLAIDPAWFGGSADAALGQWYLDVPRLFGGSLSSAEQHFRRALTYDPVSPPALIGLADVMIATHRPDDAKRLLQQMIDAPLDPDWIPEDIEYKRQAATRLKALGR